MNIDWPALEACLFRLSAREIRRFAAAHAAETFYGFMFDCNSEYGQVLLCLNTPESLRDSAVQYATNPPLQEAFDAIRRDIEEKIGKKIFDKRTPKSAEENEKEHRWSPGDWKYQGFNSEDFDRGWDSFESAVLEQCEEEEQDEETFMRPTQVRFMEAACRILLRLERENVFGVLNRTPDFSTLARDHDEDEADARARFEEVSRRPLLFP